jgi:hypothetical protein
LLGHDRVAGVPQDLVVPLLEQRGVVVVRRAVQLDDVPGLLAGRLQAADQALADRGTDLDVVEGHVVLGTAAEVGPVVVDHRDAGVGRLLDHRAARVGIQAGDDQRPDPSADHAVGDGLEAGGVVLGILDVGLHAGGLEGLLEERAVRAFPARGGLGVRQDHTDRARVSGRAAALTGRRAAVATTTAGAEGEAGRADEDHRLEHAFLDHSGENLLGSGHHAELLILAARVGAPDGPDTPRRH